MESVAGSNFRLNVCDELLVVVGGLQPWTEATWNEHVRALRGMVTFSPRRAVLIYSPSDLPEASREWLSDWPVQIGRLALVADADQPHAASAAIFWSLTGSVDARHFDSTDLRGACDWLKEAARFDPARVYQQVESALWRHTAATPTARLALTGR
jgi:hypothetical protein